MHPCVSMCGFCDDVNSIASIILFISLMVLSPPWNFRSLLVLGCCFWWLFGELANPSDSICLIFSLGFGFDFFVRIAFVG